MKKTLITSLLLSAFAIPALAQTAPAAAEAAPAPALTGNIGLFSSYRFRGIDQTFGRPALQGGFDYAHSSGLYVGNWNSNVSSGAGFPDGNLEMDFYGGYKTNVGDVGLDFGAIYYYYPGSEAKVLSTRAKSGTVNNQEVYIGASWKFLSLKYSVAIDDYFSTRGHDATSDTGQSTKGTGYLDLGAAYDLGNGWGINGHIGQLKYKNVTNGDYTDWKIGVTKDLSGWVVGAAYVDTNAKGNCQVTATNYQPYCLYNSATVEGNSLRNGTKTTDAGKGTAVVSLSRSF